MGKRKRVQVFLLQGERTQGKTMNKRIRKKKEMDRLISAERLKNELLESAKWEGVRDLGEARFTVRSILMYIDEQPTVDAAPVVHGRWLKKASAYVKNCFCCSICGYDWGVESGTLSDYRMNYCSECGAKMDGGNRG